MAAVSAYVFGCSFSCVLRSRWPRETQFPQLDIYVALRICGISRLSVSTPVSSCPAVAMDGRAEGDAGCSGMQCEIVLDLSRAVSAIWGSFLPVHGRTWRILRWALFLF